MSCPALTNKGGKLYISEEPVECDATVFDIAGAAYVQVPGVGSIGDTGIQQDIVTYPVYGSGLTPQGKGDAVGLVWEIEVLDAPSQARDILDEASAIGNDDNYATRIEWPNGDVEFSIVQVASRTAVKGAASGVRVIRYTMVPSFVPIVTTILLPPTGFDRHPPFSIYKAGPQQYTTDFDPDEYLIPSEATYYLSPTGNDSNDGLTPESPKKSVGALVTALNATPEIAKTLVLEPGWYVDSDSLDNVSFAFDHNLICEGGEAIMAYLLEPTWSKTSERTNIWQTGGIGSPSGLAVIDLSNPDSSGTPTRLKQVSGQETLDITPNAIATGATSLYVHTFDGRAPDADILIMGAAKRLWTQEENVNLFHKGIRYFGGSSPVVINGTQAGMTHVFSGCGFNYSKESANGFEIVGSKDDTYTLIMHGASARYNRLDGLNYNGSCLVIEIECPCAWNGYTYDNANDNGSTAHISVRIIRINGEYSYNSDRNVHDVNGSRSWNIGCKAGFAQNGDPDPYANFNFGSGSSGSSDSPRAWYEGCTSLGGSAGDLTAAGAAIVNTLECVGFDVITTLDTATVTDADPAAWPGRGL